MALATVRVRYPFHLEWEEGVFLDQTGRILNGESIYRRPTLEFVPDIYPPLYVYLSSALATILGPSFLPLRLVSFLSSLGCFSLLFLIVKKETGNSLAAIFASGLFAATFRISGAWFDIVRPDSLLLLLLLGAVYLIKCKNTVTASVFAGLLIALSLATKQSAIAISMAMMLAAMFLNWRRSIYSIGTAAVLGGIGFSLLGYRSAGWSNYFIFHLSGLYFSPMSGFIRENVFSFWSRDCIGKLPLALALAVLYLLSLLFSRSRRNFAFYFLTTVGMIGGAWVSWMPLSSYCNVLIPAHAALALLAGLGMHTLFNLIGRREKRDFQLVAILAYIVCIAQFAALYYDPFQQLPKPDDPRAGQELLASFAPLKGDILCPYHNYLPSMVGKKVYPHDCVVRNVFDFASTGVKEPLRKEFIAAIREQKFGAIILDSPGWYFQEEIEKYYRKERTVFDDDTVFWPVAGKRTRPKFIYVPRARNPPGDGG
jgi:4-amino-4-deoxy-L-arabinose transferase-like glycosyltransferase